MDINIDSPIKISMEVIEFDEKVPSVKFLVRVATEKFDRSVSVNMTCWMECAAFDSFILFLKSKKNASLKDMSGDFSISVDFDRSKLIWSYDRADVHGNVMRAGGDQILVDGIEKVIMEFEDFPKWW